MAPSATPGTPPRKNETQKGMIQMQHDGTPNGSSPKPNGNLKPNGTSTPSFSNRSTVRAGNMIQMPAGVVEWPPTPSEPSRSALPSPCRTPRSARLQAEVSDDNDDHSGDAQEARPDSRGSSQCHGHDAEYLRGRPQPQPCRQQQEAPHGLENAAAAFAKNRTQSHPIKPPGPHGSEPAPRSRARTRIRSYVDNESRQAADSFPRISKPVELLRSSYDVVVIGSGYGGGVSASRMARAGESVCLLERGKERWPGEYPTGTREGFEQLHWSGEFAPYFLSGKTVEGGDPTGMYHLIFGKGQNAIVANGLGGTSLMNANVFLRADEDTMAMSVWPPELRRKGALNEYYDMVEKVLEPEPYPHDWPTLPKMEMLRKQAEHLGLGDNYYRVPQTTRFRNGPNSCGVEMLPSALTGQDATGVNDGSKTTTLVTYLADAWNWGAEMFCECEVRYIEKARDGREGYIIYFAWHGRNRGHFKANLHGDLMWVHAKRAVFLGAGAIGTSEILLRSKAMGLGMSPLVGQNMSGNGDMLAFGYNTDEKVNAIGRPLPSRSNPVGPTITSVIDCRLGHENPLDGFVIEDGAVPHALVHLFQAMLDFMPGSQEPEGETVIERARAAMARWGSRLLGPYFGSGAVEKTQVYLIMSHDSNQAVLTLRDDRPVLEFLGVGRSNHVKYLNGLLAKATQAVGGTLVQNPFFALMGQQQLTVHPIGGASMARDNTGATGVTNHKGQVFSGTGSETHKGLIVTDGALVPAALGVNPFATIAALAERCLAEYAKDNDLEISQERNGILDLFGRPKHTPRGRSTAVVTACSIIANVSSRGSSPAAIYTDSDQKRQELEQKSSFASTVAEFVNETERVDEARHAITKAQVIRAGGFGFTEVMSGFIHNDPGMKEDSKETYELAFRTAKALCESARFFLSVQSFNTKSMVTDPDHRGMLTGTFVCPTIPGSPFMVQRGEFGLFILDHLAPGTRNLTYDFDMKGVNGNLLHFHGYKVVDSSVALAPFQFWRSASTLYVTITKRDHRPHLDTPEEEAWRYCTVVAKGIMQIQPSDFMSEVMTMTPTGSSLLKKAMSAANFLTYFTRKSLSLFLAPFTPLQYPSQSYSGYVNDTPPTKSFAIRASDGIFTKMHMWEATHTPIDKLTGRPTPAKNLFMIPGASVDHQIFALPTIPFNAVNYFTRAGYRVFVSVHRIGQLMVAENDWTTYDARRDLRACLEYIREHYSESGDSRRPSKVYTIAHCMGSVAFASGLLDGTIPTSWILGVTCSQVFMNPIWNTMNMAKVMAGPIPMDRLYTLLAGRWFSCSASRDDTLIQQGINQLLRFYPDERRELCNNASCHRTTLVFGRCWNHRNLNEATHRQIDRFFGGVNMRLLNLLMRMGFEGHVMGNGPLYEKLTTRDNIEKLRGIPFLLFTGRDNAVLSPEATQRTYEALCDQFGTSAAPCKNSSGTDADTLAMQSPSAVEGGDAGVINYRRKVVPGYGHLDCWMGRNAWKDIYPFVREEVDRVVRGESYRFVEPADEFKRIVEEGALLH